uniref:Conotoxin superfamily L n=1 Tax=Conus ermineus TaxID=55423 RepID=A0A346CIX4_CONER|nr:conotoxin precursor superfamily L [Conus ermineus]
MKMSVTFIVVLMLTTSLTCGFSLFSNNGDRAVGPHDPDAADQLVREERANLACNPPCTGNAMCQNGACGYIRFR